MAIHTSAARVSLTLALISLSVPAAPSLWAQADQWEKHMKSGRKDYSGGMNQKYFHGWGNAGPNPQFAKAEEEFLAALADTQAFPPGDMRTAETLGALATVYMEEGKYDDAESKGTQAIAMMEAAAQPNDIRLGYALTHLALIYDSQGKTAQAAPIWERSLGIVKSAGGVDPEEISNLKFHASFIGSFHPAAAAQIHQYILDLKESTGISDADLRIELAQSALTQRGADAGTGLPAPAGNRQEALWPGRRQGGRGPASAWQALLGGRKIHSGAAAVAAQSGNSAGETGPGARIQDGQAI